MLCLCIGQIGTKFTVIRPSEHCYVSTHTNTFNFLLISFVPHFVHILECVPQLCLKITCVMPLNWSNWYKFCNLARSGQQHHIMLQSILDNNLYIWDWCAIEKLTFLSVGTYLQLNQVLPILFSTNMVIAGHTGRILKFWLQILNPLEIWVQKIYRSTHIMLLWVNLILGLEYQNSYNVSYKLDIKIPISDPESVHQIGPDGIWIKSFGGGHVMFSLYPRLIWP